MRRLIDKFSQKTGYWGIPLILATCCFIFGVNEKGWNKTYINGDGKGYYAYLPAVFIYNDLSFGFIEQYEAKHYLPGQLCDFRQPVDGGVVNRYYAGTAVAQLPFFLLAHTASRLTGTDPDGYSWPYQYAVLLAACFYLFIGLWALSSFLNVFFRKKTVMFVLISITLATPLLFYTVYNPDFSHIYSFAFISLFVKYAWLFYRNPTPRMVMLLFLLLGMITIIRPVNIIIAGILPFMAFNLKDFIEKTRFVFRNYSLILYGSGLFLLVISIQLIVYYVQTGNFIVYSYGEAGFNFFDPQFFNFLFSYRKGAFLYTPFLFLCLAGFWYLSKESVYRAVALFLFLLLVIYILSSWSVWTYGMTYGQRPLIEYYFVFAILCGYLIQIPKRKYSVALASGLILITIPHNLMQMSQHRHYILHWDEMNREKYWTVFFRTDPIYYGYLWNPILPISDNAEGYSENCINGTISAGMLLNSGDTLPPLSIRTSAGDTLDVLFLAQVFPHSNVLKNNTLQVQVRRKNNSGEGEFDFEITLRNVEAKKWSTVSRKIKLPKTTADEEFVVTVVNKGKHNFTIDKVCIKPKS